MVSPASSPGVLNSTEIADHFSRAKSAEAKGNFPYAETLYANILHSKPDEHRARILLRKCQVARFRQKHGNTRPAGRFTSGIAFLASKPGAEPLRDVELAEIGLKDNPCDIGPNQLLLSAAQRLQWPEIEQLCLDQIAEGTPTPANIIARADGLRLRREFARAVAVLEEAQRQQPSNLQLEKALRDAHAEQTSESGWTDARDFTEMIRPQAQIDESKNLAERIQKEPRNTALVDQLIVVLDRAGNEEAVLEWIAYRRGIEENPALRRKAFEIQRKRGYLTPEAELEELDAFVRQQPQDLELQLLLGQALLGHRDAQRAIPHLQRARKIGRTTGRVEALISLAAAYDSVGLAELGEKSRNQALELAREDEGQQKEILYQMALCLDSRGRKAEAKARWIELFEIDAEYKDATQRVLGDSTGIEFRA